MYTHLQRDAGRPPVTLATLQRMKADGEKIACAHLLRRSFAVLLDAAGVDVVLVGDSLGMVIQGHDTTVPVTMDHIVYHSAAVARGLQRAVPHRRHAVHELPDPGAGARERGAPDAGGRRADGEAGERRQADARSSSSSPATTSPVCAHLGLKPQSVHKTGGFRVQGREQARPRPPARGGAGAGGRGRRHRAARVRPDGARQERSPRRCTCR